jgi:hypothetical protein
MNVPTEIVEDAIRKLADGDLLWSRGDIDGALHCYSEAIALDPNNDEINSRLTAFMLAKVASARERVGNWDGAIAAWKAFLPFDPDNAYVRKKIGLAMFGLGRASEAEEYLVPLLSVGDTVVREEIVASVFSMLSDSKDSVELLSQRFSDVESLVKQVPNIASEVRGVADEWTHAGTSVCVAGMHRSGTSMVARLLGTLGMSLGLEKHLVAPQKDNPEGYFENGSMALFNDSLLAALGGGWDSPPEPDFSVLGQDSLEWFRARAKLLTAAIASTKSSSNVWGWKDPRNSLTLPFWHEVLPEMKVVVVVRDPGDVAYSLKQRGGYHTTELGLNLWHTYYERIFSSLAEKKFHVIRYESVFEQPDAEIERLGRFIGVDIDDDLKSRARSSIRPYLRHNVSKVDWRELPAGKALFPVFERLTTLASI